MMLIPDPYYRQPPKKPKCGLTQTQILKIKSIVVKCEIPGCNSPPYEVHHIRFCNEGGDNRYGNLIVLCANHHSDAHGKNPHGNSISKGYLYEIVKRRSSTKANQIKAVLASSNRPKRKDSERDPYRDILGF